jgi:cell division protein FtsZ
MSGPNSPSEVVALGIGSAGIRIVSALSRETTLVNRFAYLTCDRADLESAGEGEQLVIESPVVQKPSPSMVRGFAMPHREEMKSLVKDAKVVFVVAGLGRATGSGLAPMMAGLASEAGAEAVSIAVMPFDFEERLRFYAGLALKKLRAVSKGVVVVDNGSLFNSGGSDATLKDLHDLANKEAVKALGSLLARQSQDSIPVGLNKVLGTVTQGGYSFLTSASSGSTDKAEEALSRALIRIGKKAQMKDASHAVVVLTGDASISASETATAVRRLGFMFGNPSLDVEYAVSYRSGAGSQLQVSVLASGFTQTKYDSYDPIDAILGAKNNIDDELECALVAGLERVAPCDQ